MSNGWIKLHRSLLDWEWYDDKNARLLLIHLLVSVNYEDKKWKGQEIKAGSMVLSWDTLSREVGLSKQQLRTAMQKLENSGELTRYVTNKFQVVTLVKWGKLQGDNTQATDKPTYKQQTSNRQVTPTKEIKKERINIPFLDFWNLYGKKKGNRSSCEKKWNRLKVSEREEIIETLPNFKKSVSDIQYLPYPETYLNGRRWEDVIEQPEPKRATGQFRDHLC